MAATATAGAVAGIGAAHDPPYEHGGGGSALGPAWWLGGPSGPGGGGCLVYFFCLITFCYLPFTALINFHNTLVYLKYKSSF